MAGPSGRAFGPPKGMLVPALHAFLCVSPASRGWPGQGPAMTRGQRPRPPPRYVSASADKPGHDGKVRPMRLNQTAACCSFDNTGVAALATTAIGQISSAINAGATIVASSGNAALPVLPAGQEGIVAASGSGIYQLTGGYIGIVIGDNVPATVVGGSAD